MVMQTFMQLQLKFIIMVAVWFVLFVCLLRAVGLGLLIIRVKKETNVA